MPPAPITAMRIPISLFISDYQQFKRPGPTGARQREGPGNAEPGARGSSFIPHPSSLPFAARHYARRQAFDVLADVARAREPDAVAVPQDVVHDAAELAQPVRLAED